jgi:predicted deacylase
MGRGIKQLTSLQIRAGRRFPVRSSVLCATVSVCLLLSLGDARASEESDAETQALDNRQLAESTATDEQPTGITAEEPLSPAGNEMRNTVDVVMAAATPPPDEADDSLDESLPASVIAIDTLEGDPAAEARIAFIGPPVPERATNAAADESKKPQVAENIDLSEPVVPEPDVEAISIGLITPPERPDLTIYEQKSLVMLGAEVPAGTSTRLAWSPDQSFEGIAVPTPVLVVNGAKPGPTLCLTAAIHGDELNGIEVVRRVLYDLKPEKLSGAVIGVPIVNLQGFRRSSRYLPDRRDLNRYFPGNPRGSAAARLAHSFFNEVITHCDALVDLHTGSFQRTNLPQLRANLQVPEIVELTQGFGSTVVLHGVGAEGTLRRAASDAGIPTVTVEAGEPARIQAKEVEHSSKGVMTLLNELDMYSKTTNWGNREPVYYRSTWVRADSGGVLFGKVDLGDRVREGQLLGTITDPITNVQTELRASVKGRILGKALDQFVMPGFAAFRIGMERDDREIPAPTAIKVTAVDAENTVDTAESPASPALAETEDGLFDDHEEESTSPAFVDTHDESFDDHEEAPEFLDDHRDSLEDSE